MVCKVFRGRTSSPAFRARHRIIRAFPPLTLLQSARLRGGVAFNLRRRVIRSMDQPFQPAAPIDVVHFRHSGRRIRLALKLWPPAFRLRVFKCFRVFRRRWRHKVPIRIDKPVLPGVRYCLGVRFYRLLIGNVIDAIFQLLLIAGVFFVGQFALGAPHGGVSRRFRNRSSFNSLRSNIGQIVCFVLHVVQIKPKLFAFLQLLRDHVRPASDFRHRDGVLKPKVMVFGFQGQFGANFTDESPVRERK